MATPLFLLYIQINPCHQLEAFRRTAIVSLKLVVLGRMCATPPIPSY